MVQVWFIRSWSSPSDLLRTSKKNIYLHIMRTYIYLYISPQKNVFFNNTIITARRRAKIIETYIFTGYIKCVPFFQLFSFLLFPFPLFFLLFFWKVWEGRIALWIKNSFLTERELCLTKLTFSLSLLLEY